MARFAHQATPLAELMAMLADSPAFDWSAILSPTSALYRDPSKGVTMADPNESYYLARWADDGGRIR